MKYKVVYKGELKRGVSKEQTLAKLSKFSGFDRDKAEKVFFSGEPVKLKIIDGGAETKAFIKRLSDMGIIARVIKIDDPSTVQQPPKTPTSKPSSDNSREKNQYAHRSGKKSATDTQIKVNKTKSVARPATAKAASSAAKSPEQDNAAQSAAEVANQTVSQPQNNTEVKIALAERAKIVLATVRKKVEELTVLLKSKTAGKRKVDSEKETQPTETLASVELTPHSASQPGGAPVEEAPSVQQEPQPETELQPGTEPQPETELQPETGRQTAPPTQQQEKSHGAEHTDTSPRSEPLADLPPVKPGTSKKAKPKKTNKWLIPTLGVFAALVVIVVGVYFFVVSSIISTEVPVQVKKAENALLQANVALLGHINVKRIFELEDLLAKDKGTDILRDIEIAQQLQAQGANLRAELSQIVVGLHFDEALGSYLTQVIITNTPKGVLTNFLKQHYVLEPQLRGNIELLTFSQQDKQTCRISDPRSLIVGNGFVVISHPQKVYDLYQAVVAADANIVVNEQWLTYRDSHLLSLGILNPEQLEKGLPGMMGLLLMEAQSQWASMQSVFLGVRGAALPPAIKFDFSIESNNRQWLEQSKGSLSAIVQKHREAIANNESNFISLLISRVDLNQGRNTLSTEFTVDQELVNAGTDMLSEGLRSAMVSSTPVAVDTPDPIEIIDENPTVYQPQLSLEQLPPFMNQNKRQYAWADKYFAAHIKSVGINRDGLKTIALEVEGAQLPNQPNSYFGEPAHLVVEDVVDGEGNSIMQKETCGMNLNHEPAKFEMNSATKLIRLNPGASIEQASALKARVDAVVPTRTEAMVLSVPLQQTEFENNGSKLTITGVNKGSVSYTLSGKPGGYLALRALNNDRKYLRTGSVFGFSGAMNHEFAGTIAFVEIIKALETAPVSAKIEIHRPNILFPADGFTLRPIEPKAYSEEEWNKMLDFSRDFKPDQEKHGWYGDPVVASRSGPAELKLYDPKVFRNFEGPAVSAKLEANMPYVRILDNKSNLAKLRVKEIIFDDGTRYTETSEHPITMQFTGFGNRAKVAELPEERLRQNIYLTGTTEIEIPLKDQEYVDKKIILLTGELSFRIPTAIQTKEYTELALGRRYEVNEALALEIIELSHTGMKIAARGDASVLSGLQVLNQKGRLLEEGVSFEKEEKRFGVKPNYQGEEEPPARFVSNYYFKGKPDKIRVALAESSQTFVYPFGLPVKAPN